MVGHRRSSPQVLDFRCVPTAMHKRLLLVAAMLIAAVLTGVFTLDRPSGSQQALGSRGAVESPKEAAKELQAPADAMLARALFGADKGVNPSRYFARAAAQATALGD